MRLTYNSGFSFGMGARFAPLVAVVVLVIAFALGRAAMRERGVVRLVLFAVILGGALGNIVDRLLRADAGPLPGNVVDFVAITWYAVFNVADMFMVCGAVVLALTELRRDLGSEPDAV